MLAKEFTQDMKIPREFKGNTEEFAPIGWMISEKLDGYRGRYNPETNSFISRQNKPYVSPDWFLDAIPNIHLDGELFCGRDGFQKMGAVRKKIPVDEEWFNIKFYVYDAPEINGQFSKRYSELIKIVELANSNWNTLKVQLGSKFTNVTCPLVLTEHYVVKDSNHMNTFYQNVLKQGGEGIMIKNPKSFYEDKRSNNLLKYKPNFDAEAIIIDYKPGTGKYMDMLGAFVCKPLLNKGSYQIKDTNTNHEFAISGMDDSVRNTYKSTHPIGTIITYEYSGFTNTGKPRFARYIRVRTDVSLKQEIEMEIVSQEKLKNTIKIFKTIAKHETSNGEGFKASAYNKTVKVLESMSNDSEITANNLLSIKGIGQKMVDKVMQIVITGTCPLYDQIKNKVDPREIFMNIHGVGPTKANQLVKLGINTIQDLRNRIDLDDILNDTQKKGLHWYEDILQKIPRSEIVKHEVFLKNQLKLIDPTAEVTITGSYRRGKLESGDIDVLVKTPSVKNTSVYEKFLNALFESDEPYILENLSRGKKKFMGICRSTTNGVNGRRIDIMFTKPNEYPFAILYFTGSMEFNVKMRNELTKKGFSLNEYCLKNIENKQIIPHNCITEKDVFQFLGYDYIEPINR
tara:strand:+ start:2758 stop:4638 length:1881 start_codon:yes stop_codon:yes gene_type:complete